MPNPPHAHKTRRLASDRRSSEFSLEELSEDDVGYDADIEVVRPEYEDVDSGNDDNHEEHGYDSETSEDHLADRLRGLYCDPSMVSSDTQQSLKKGRKRMSKEMEGGKVKSSMQSGRSDLEILELSVHTDDKHPAKRQRNRLARSKTGERIVRLALQDRTENASKSGTDSSILASSPCLMEGMTTPEVPDLEMLDMIEPEKSP